MYHSYSKTDGRKSIKTAYSECDAVLKDIVGKLPTNENGYYTKIEFINKLPSDISNELNDAISKHSFPEDSYVIDTRNDTIRIFSDGRRGLIYGAYTLLREAEDNNGEIEVGVIYDSPRCPFRGLKVYMPAPNDLESYYKTVDLLMSLRYNYIIIEIGGAMEYKKHPEINEAWIEYCKEMNRYPERAVEIQHSYPWDKNSIHFENGGGLWLKQDEIKKMIDYTAERGMEIVPECPTLSHSDYLLMPHPEFAEQKDDDFPDVYCPSNPETYKLVFDVLDEVIDLFNPKIIHIGHDEYYSIGICPLCKGKPAEQIYADDIIKIHDYLAKKNIKTMIWAEKLLNANNDGKAYGGSERIRYNPDGSVRFYRPPTYKCADLIPRDVICHHWYYNIHTKYDVEFTSRGFPMTYGNFNPRSFYNWNYRLKAGALGGAPSHWSSLEDATLQRNGVYMSIFFGEYLFWDEDYDEDNYAFYYGDTISRMYKTANKKTLASSHFEITHTTTIERPYQYLSSVPMQLTRDTIGKYVITYNDGETIEFPIVYGLNITNENRTWERRRATGMENPYGEPNYGYTGDSLLNEVTYTTLPHKEGDKTVFDIVLPNPHPEKEIKSIETVKTCEDMGDITLVSFKTV